jgi:integrase
MDRVLAETKVKEGFTEHDLRAKVGSDAESLEKARALLQHADARTTARVYRRNVSERPRSGQKLPRNSVAKSAGSRVLTTLRRQSASGKADLQRPR